MTSRRNFIKKTTLAGAAVTIGHSAMAMSAKSYNNIVGSNERIHVAIAGLGRRMTAFKQPIALKESNAKLLYLCDVMESQRAKGLKAFREHIDYNPILENDIRKVLDDKNVDVLINATPDHWHTPGSIMAMKAGKHVYVEKPCSHNMYENEQLVKASKHFNKVVQMGNQQRSSGHTIEIINEIHNGVIGKPYKAVAFYNNGRGQVPLQKNAAIPQGLDWELWQGPAPRRDYTSETWDYNWHWYGWEYGTAEAGNNGTHELDVARWALQVDFPQHVYVEAEKRHFLNDGWEMYDDMEATFKFKDNKVIKWDGKSRNSYKTYGTGRGTVIYGTEGSVFVDRGKYMLYDRRGKLVKEYNSSSNEAGTALGGGGDTTTKHVINLFDTIRGKAKLTAPIDDASISMAMVHYANIAYRINSGFDIDNQTGMMYNREAMKLWSRTYEAGWDPVF
ncbi:twin-arginine translocation signal domain-containing protein [Algibacter amylolyticus]|uniref:Twin-arginine translocation signal domain-containing protein n=1 Tax=Algibacter amylolyticus TaxID=1608400 RepID=A0A5M7B828_9FLAO|nr:Gfo/Idh/MocA family oxidoreductase [Algibacter amylolyticus]KAA5824810.1 twin-arginine translocation signal domain-containing protein [Algibacter amylolyticus]MBB5268930.1 putative dehydrogenase [Algibacter amylolyticus]TSJ75975.1 twin-arginine translocation signal domain-containing protein [Algibacter amylolyticus]